MGTSMSPIPEALGMSPRCPRGVPRGFIRDWVPPPHSCHPPRLGGQFWVSPILGCPQFWGVTKSGRGHRGSRRDKDKGQGGGTAVPSLSPRCHPQGHGDSAQGTSAIKCKQGGDRDKLGGAGRGHGVAPEGWPWLGSPWGYRGHHWGHEGTLRPPWWGDITGGQGQLGTSRPPLGSPGDIEATTGITWGCHLGGDHGQDHWGHPCGVTSATEDVTAMARTGGDSSVVAMGTSLWGDHNRGHSGDIPVVTMGTSL